MFVVSLKTSRRRLFSLVLCAAVAVAMLIALVCFPASRAMVTMTAPGESDEACAVYLKTLGYTAALPADEVREIRLPEQFDDALAAYNTLQRTVGFDLSDYAGQRVKLRTFTLDDHSSGHGAQAHLYVYDEVIIGGDITDAAGNVTPLCQETGIIC